MSKYSEYEYMYSAVKIAALSGKLPDYAVLARLCEATPAELPDRLSETGIKPVINGTEPDYELSLNGFLAAQYQSLTEFLPDSEPVAVMRFRYDCHNIKTAIRCTHLNIPCSRYMIDCGNIPADRISEAAAKHKFDCIPGEMGKAAVKADEIASSGSSMRSADVLIDNACFADMRKTADAFGFEAAKELIALKTDLTNLMTVLRTLRIKNRDTAALILSDSLLDGGKLPLATLRDVKTPDEVAALAESTIGADFAEALKNSLSDGLDAVSRLFDNEFLRSAHGLCSVSQLGVLPVAGYLIDLEYAVKNIRIITSGIITGNDADTIRERLRVNV